MFGFSTPKVPQVNAEDVKKAIDAKEKVFLLDVRTPGEFAKGTIGGSVNIPVDRINTVTNTVPDTSAKIFVYCLSGSRSVQAVDAMVKLGYSNVFDMKSGLLAWRGKGYQVTA